MQHIIYDRRVGTHGDAVGPAGRSDSSAVFLGATSRTRLRAARAERYRGKLWQAFGMAASGHHLAGNRPAAAPTPR